MEQNNWLEYKIQVRERLRKYALETLKLSEELPNTKRGNVINYQVSKSGTSMYANYRAALRGRSKKEFFSKLSISVEEADETKMWIDLIIASALLQNDFISKLHTESTELLKILSSMRKKVGE